MIKITSNFDADGIMKKMMDEAHERYAQAAADGAIKNGLANADDIDAFTFKLTSDSPEIDLERVEKRAREILRERLR